MLILVERETDKRVFCRCENTISLVLVKLLCIFVVVDRTRHPPPTVSWKQITGFSECQDPGCDPLL